MLSHRTRLQNWIRTSDKKHNEAIMNQILSALLLYLVATASVIRNKWWENGRLQKKKLQIKIIVAEVVQCRWRPLVTVEEERDRWRMLSLRWLVGGWRPPLSHSYPEWWKGADGIEGHPVENELCGGRGSVPWGRRGCHAASLLCHLGTLRWIGGGRRVGGARRGEWVLFNKHKDPIRGVGQCRANGSVILLSYSTLRTRGL